MANPGRIGAYFGDNFAAGYMKSSFAELRSLRGVQLANHGERAVTTFFEHPALVAARHALLSKQMGCPPGARAPMRHVPSAVDEASRAAP